MNVPGNVFQKMSFMVGLQTTAKIVVDEYLPLLLYVVATFSKLQPTYVATSRIEIE